MEVDKINILINKYLQSKATQEELDQLNEWYRHKSSKEHLWISNNRGEEEQVRIKMLQQIKKHISQSQKKNTYKAAVWTIRQYSVVASIALILSIGLYFFLFDKQKLSGQVSVALQQPENRFVVLPDSSTVILRPGAKLNYTFTSDKREVNLLGEAYFDVRSDKQRPFVVETGDISTHVLGTSFSIQAYTQEEVVVAVHTGHVSVRNKDKKLLARLVPDEQFEYSHKNTIVDIKTTVLKNKIEWIHTDMRFSDIPFDDVIASLNRRYNSQIELENPAMKGCLITGSFNGTEDLKTVLDVLATTTGSTYSRVGVKALFKGEGCVNTYHQ